MKKVQLKILAKQLNSMTKSIMAKASKAIPVITSNTAEPEDEELKVQCEEAVQAAREAKSRLETQEQELIKTIMTSIQKQHADIEAAIVSMEDTTPLEDRGAGQWPSEVELERMHLLREEIQRSLSNLEVGPDSPK